jgi:hypothetical protein
MLTTRLSKKMMLDESYSLHNTTAEAELRPFSSGKDTLAPNPTCTPRRQQKMGKISRLSPLRKTTRCIRDAVSICTYAYLARWLWSFDRQFGNYRNMMTMVYGFICLIWTPRVTLRSIAYSIFAVGFYGTVIKWLWWSVNQDYLVFISKSLSLLFGLKSICIILGLASVLGVDLVNS